MPQPTPTAVINNDSIAICAPGGSVVVSPQLTTAGRVHASTLMSTMMATVAGTVYFSNVRIA